MIKTIHDARTPALTARNVTEPGSSGGSCRGDCGRTAIPQKVRGGRRLQHLFTKLIRQRSGVVARQD